MPVPGEEGGWDVRGQNQGWQSTQREPASQGEARAGDLGSGQLDPFQTFPPAGSGGAWEGEPSWEGGAPFTESPGSKLRWAGGCFLKLWKEQTNTESWGRCQTQSSLPGECCRRGEARNIWKAQHLPRCWERQPPLHSLPFPFPFCSLRCLPGTSVPMAWLCVASSSGHLGHGGPCPQAVTARGERHRGRR